MKIVYITNSRIPTEKAHGLQTMKMCEALAKTGAEVELIVPNRRNAITADPFDYWQVEKIFFIKKIGVIDLLSFSFIPKGLAFYVESISFFFSALLFMWGKSVDYIYLRDKEMTPLALFTRIPIIFEVHFIPNFLKFYLYIFRKIRVLAPITQHSSSFLIKAGVPINKICVLPDAVDLKKFALATVSKNELRMALNLPKDKRIIMYTGQLFLWKGVGTLLESSLYLPRDDFLVVIVGGSPDDIKKAKRVSHKNVFFAGQRRSEEIPRWLQSADILVIPNSGKYDISRYYTSPMKLFEYMASKVPIVSADLPSLREVITEKEAVFFKPDIPRDLAKAVSQILENKELALLLSESAHRKVQDYTWEKRALKILNKIQ